jgi:hypothetical protein
MVGTRHGITSLTAFPARCAGTDAERRAAVHLRGRLEAMDRDAEVQTIDVRPRFALAHALHALMAVVGSVLAVSAAAPGAALVLAAALLTFLDAYGILQVLRRLLGRRASQNVESRENGGKPGTLILVAGYDSPRESGAFAAASRLLRDPWLVLLASMLVILACCALRLADVESTAVTVAQFVPTVLLILLIPALLDVELSSAGEDPAGAAAVEAALGVAGDVGGRLDHFDLWVVLTGANQPFALGMGAWLRRRRKALDRERTAIVAVGPAGDGPVHYTRREGPIVRSRCHSDLVRLSGEIGEDAAEDGVTAPFAYVSREPSNATRAIAKGLPSITVSTDGRAAADEQDTERLRAFTRELVERLDRDVGPSL